MIQASQPSPTILTPPRTSGSVGHRLHGRKPARRGIAAVEFAVVMPILLVMVLGTLEVCQRLFLRQTATVTAYEGIRLAARKTSNANDVIRRCNALLADRRVAGATVKLTPASFHGLTTGMPIKIEIAIPWADNSATRFVLKDQGRIIVTSTMLRE